MLPDRIQPDYKIFDAIIPDTIQMHDIIIEYTTMPDTTMFHKILSNTIQPDTILMPNFIILFISE